ncbi:MAG TPA: sugar phosphate isomerase/epimerase and 4-hydroxyphenylpyruvate domain-containing protein [Candidatus Corynebacterium avicola]|uniref:3-dehydroshikimate dehydratase n=1 Tax=Candidatus Corynebacterium avicola TaxID=2838527 RepID=A0A9D1RRT4_9CORY|nr:sugar phosphate isomerase/epimerase and 4-hydroxyphenylpyruvate domain-containing protein [Candidatus Corynebacterium avicola]
MRTSIATVCLSGTLAEKLRAAADAGFDGVEIFEQDLVVSPHSPEQIRERGEELGLSFDLYQPFRDFDGVSEDVFVDNLRRLEAKFRVMQRLGIDMILICSNVGTATVDDDAVCADQLRRAGDLAKTYGIKLAYEALAWGRYVNTYRHAYRIVEMADHPNVGTCLDSFHILSRGDDPSGISDIPGEKIFFVQLADAPSRDMDLLSWSRHHRVFPGEGDFDLVGFLRLLTLAGYDGPVSLEIFNDSFRQSEVGRTAVDGLRSLRWLEDQAFRTLGGSNTAAGDHPVGLEPLPEAPVPGGYSFVELHTGRLGEITKLLHQLGFILGGYHRSKPDFQVWVQGDARIVVRDLGPTGSDTVLDSFGVDVEGADRSAVRAARLSATPINRQRQDDEAELHGVNTPDGTGIFFCETTTDGVPVWADEFGLIGEDVRNIDAVTGPTSRVTGVDHVGLAQRWHRHDEAALYFTSVLGLQPHSSDPVPSPAGFVYSRVMTAPRSDFSLTLTVVPEGSEQGDFLAAAYPEHVTLAASDIIGVARRARRRGLEILPVPQNYYDDLVARFDLDEETVSELRDCNILYDRDDQGEYLRFYTGTLGAVFFELVERRGNYTGHGVDNIPVRLAAQYRVLRDATRGIPQ